MSTNTDLREIMKKPIVDLTADEISALPEHMQRWAHNFRRRFEWPGTPSAA